MKRTKATTEINNEQSLKLTSIAGLQDLSESENQTIQGGHHSTGTLKGIAGRVWVN